MLTSTQRFTTEWELCNGGMNFPLRTAVHGKCNVWDPASSMGRNGPKEVHFWKSGGVLFLSPAQFSKCHVF